MTLRDGGCGCSKSQRRWKLIRLALLLAGISLALYMPYKAATQFDALEHIYGPWFLQGAVVAVAGLFFTLRPNFSSRLPLLLRVGVVAAAVLWMRTGLQCTPHLLTLTQASLAQGSFAWLHMSVQHLFLSAGVAAFAVAPNALAARMGFQTASDTSVREAPLTVTK